MVWDVRIIVGVRYMRPSIMYDRQNDVSPRSSRAAILYPLNKACVATYVYCQTLIQPWCQKLRTIGGGELRGGRGRR